MAEAAKVTVEDVQRVAELANLELEAGEEARMLRDLNAILGHVAQLNELDTSSVEAMAQVTEILALPALPALETLRPDLIRPSLDRSVVLDGAPETDGVFFKVPKVLER
ncbi:MAG TPA: Asp-tRNA(Asn)/Glu-tRNA(Gln) amidotransferase subunit GatC [Acidisarcina sp.]|nr:Asp-tRNA(Asn)/Glu-tRNA(Gln) amidotransferase subunit GatC [Acidisarcina sp.]